ncbi:hypothetical protein QWY79_08665 [Halomonas sabkhae]|uniref:hypothetical protein n=1 Tax=Halomonas sabkhae TaxID=626223 RepID=UPI0025B3D164|nr:hypothetical protein [Halomonas sabkhae]MDN3525344.1 hypothetical protein [Halomonas sabkhae]
MTYRHTLLGFTAVLLLLSVITGQNANAENEKPAQRLFYIDKAGNRFDFTQTCVQDMHLGQDANDRAVLEFDMKNTAKCHGEMNNWVVKRMGEQVSLRFAQRVVSTTTMQSPLGAENLRIGGTSPALLEEIHDVYAPDAATDDGTPEANQEK